MYNFSGLIFNMGGIFFSSFFGNHPVYHQVSDVELAGEDTVYTIAFSGLNPPSGETYVKINSADFGVMELQTTFFWVDSKKGISEFDYQVYLKTQRVGGRYYPKELKVVLRRQINRLYNANQLDIHNFFFERVQTKDYKRIKASDRLAPNKLLDVTDYKYNIDFWNSYLPIRQYLLDSDIKQSLESKGSLEVQFVQTN